MLTRTRGDRMLATSRRVLLGATVRGGTPEPGSEAGNFHNRGAYVAEKFFFAEGDYRRPSSFSGSSR